MTRSYYDKLTRLLICDLRGNKTQTQMSQNLGYTYNQWAKWESGQKRVMWNDLIDILKYLKINIYPTLSVIIHEKVSTKTSEDMFFMKLLTKYGGLEIDSVHLKFGISQSTFYRYLKNHQNVPVAVILQALDLLTSLLPYFIKELSPTPKGHELKKISSKIESHLNMEGQHPWVSAVEAILETRGYLDLPQHSSTYIAKKLGLSTEKIKYALKILNSVNAVEFKNKKYILINKSVNLETSIETSSLFTKYWTQVALNRFNTSDGVPASRTGWTIRVYPVSKEAKEKIKKARRKFESEFMSILTDDDSVVRDQLQVLIFHLFDDEEFMKTKLLSN